MMIITCAFDLRSATSAQINAINHPTIVQPNRRLTKKIPQLLLVPRSSAIIHGRKYASAARKKEPAPRTTVPAINASILISSSYSSVDGVIIRQSIAVVNT
ncbi:hypothetical protein CJ20_005 [Escherichia phage CJ20]|nr:hypothetical protein CJ20_005 [Escherichia phage CJ20]